VTHYSDHDATALAQHVRDGRLSARDVLEDALAAIAAANPQLNAVVESYGDLARGDIDRGLPDGPLAGVPILLKDLGCPARGTRTTHGSRMFRDAASWSHDCAYVDFVRRAGAVVLGRTNSCEFGISLITEPTAYGPTHNPHAPGRSPGGSSGGAAAAVASGMVPIAHATDGCGSIRVPASHCGLVGLKPSRGRISFGPDTGDSWAGMSVNGTLTRSVRDTALMMDVVARPYPGDTYALHRPVRSFCDLAEQPPPSLRIGVAVAPDDLDGECRRAVDHAAALCANLGHDVVPIAFETDLSATIPSLIVIWATQLTALIGDRDRGSDGMERISSLLLARAAAFGATDHLAATRHLNSFSRDFAARHDAFDVLLTPVASRPPWRIGTLRTDGDDLDAYMTDLFDLCLYTVQYNITGRPAISLPLHRTAGALPVGVQFAARAGDDVTLLQLARQIERAAPWASRIQSTIRAWQPGAELGPRAS